MRNRFAVSVAAGTTWSSATAKQFAPYSWIHLENRGVEASGNDVLVDVLSSAALNQVEPDGFWRYLAAGQRLTANICGPDDAPAEALTLTNIGTAAVVVFVEISSTPIVNFSDFPFPPSGGGGGGGTVTQGPAAGIAGAWPVEVTDGVHGPAAVTAANAMKVDGSAVTQPENLTQVGGAALALGQAAMAGSVPVVVANNQSAVDVQGDVASGAANVGNPLQTGGVAAIAAPAAVANGQRVAVQLDKFGRQVVQPHAPLDRQEQNALTLTTAVSTAVFAAAGAGIRHAVTHIHISNTSAAAVRVDVLDGATVIFSTEAAAGGGGAGEDFTLPLLGSANTALNVQLSAAVTDVRVTIVGYQTA